MNSYIKQGKIKKKEQLKSQEETLVEQHMISAQSSKPESDKPAYSKDQ